MTGIIAPPVTYAVDGVQYVAVMAGWGGVGVPSGDARSSIVPEYGNDGRLLVFRLDGPGQVTIPAKRDISIPEPPAMDYDQADLALGSRLYMERCNFCHGPLGFSTGVVPDLRRMDASVHEIFGDVVLRGARLAGGMPSFEDVLDEKDVRAIHAYVIEQARTTR
jgi:quinohemoprotein ethanol dehydrogenase